MKALKSHRSFDGWVRFWEHDSTVTRTKMHFSTYLPPAEVKGCLIWLSGLTCTDENFMAKAGAQKYLSEAGLMVICPDTSPRGLNLPAEHENWDFGSGAGFYLDATTEGYKDHYRMYSYVTQELYSIVEREFGARDHISISGHSMGGHGALVIGLRERAKFKSVSAFSPIVNPSRVPWGKKAFAGYLGPATDAWNAYDACELVKSGLAHPNEILIDQGTDDSFLAEQLQTDAFTKVCKGTKQKARVRMQEGYDHSYYFISSFMADHIRFHSEHI